MISLYDRDMTPVKNLKKVKGSTLHWGKDVMLTSESKHSMNLQFSTNSLEKTLKPNTVNPKVL